MAPVYIVLAPRPQVINFLASRHIGLLKETLSQMSHDRLSWCPFPLPPWPLAFGQMPKRPESPRAVVSVHLTLAYTFVGIAKMGASGKNSKIDDKTRVQNAVDIHRLCL